MNFPIFEKFRDFFFSANKKTIFGVKHEVEKRSAPFQSEVLTASTDVVFNGQVAPITFERRLTNYMDVRKSKLTVAVDHIDYNSGLVFQAETRLTAPQPNFSLFFGYDSLQKRVPNFSKADSSLTAPNVFSSIPNNSLHDEKVGSFNSISVSEKNISKQIRQEILETFPVVKVMWEAVPFLTFLFFVLRVVTTSKTVFLSGFAVKVLIQNPSYLLLSWQFYPEHYLPFQKTLFEKAIQQNFLLKPDNFTLLELTASKTLEDERRMVLQNIAQVRQALQVYSTFILNKLLLPTVFWPALEQSVELLPVILKKCGVQYIFTFELTQLFCLFCFFAFFVPQITHLGTVSFRLIFVRVLSTRKEFIAMEQIGRDPELLFSVRSATKNSIN